jgi:hypothetical protein
MRTGLLSNKLSNVKPYWYCTVLAAVPHQYIQEFPSVYAAGIPQVNIAFARPSPRSSTQQFAPTDLLLLQCMRSYIAPGRPALYSNQLFFCNTLSFAIRSNKSKLMMSEGSVQNHQQRGMGAHQKMTPTAAAVFVAIAALLWSIDIFGYVQCVSWLGSRYGTAKAAAFSAVLRWNFLPPWPEATAHMELAVSDTSEFFVFEPTAETGSPGPATGFLFITGALVHPHSYAPILSRIANESGALCVCVKPRFRHPGIWSSDVERTVGVMRQFPRVRSWYIGGHSMGAGGFGAARVASHLLLRGADEIVVAGLVMWAGVVTKSTGIDLSGHSQLRSLVILGSEDSVVPPDGKAEDGTLVRSNLKRYGSPKTRLEVIKGANHGGFGHYGPQRFPRLDNPRTISLDQQQGQVIKHTAQFLRGR